jgi:CHAT domain-containing protein
VRPITYPENLVRSNVFRIAAIIGSAFFAVSSSGSNWRLTSGNSTPPASLEINHEGVRLFTAGQYSVAREVFRRSALDAERAGNLTKAAVNWNNAGGSSLAMTQLRDALKEFSRSIKISSTLHNPLIQAPTFNNLASLYIQLGNPEAAAQISRQALNALPDGFDPKVRAKLENQLAQSLASLGRMAEARPFYIHAIADAEDQNDLNTAARILAAWGIDYLVANRLDEAESVLTEALRLVRVHRLDALSLVNVLRGLARLKALRGEQGSAAVLFQSAIDAPPGMFQRWRLFADRGDARFAWGDVRGSLDDFREASRLAAEMKADMVPADQDRVVLESGLNRIAAGLVDAGNRLAIDESDGTLLEETFEAAERDRNWSLRALIPEPNDWRTRLPGSYWDVLARYQSVERAILSQPSPELAIQASALRLSLQQTEAEANPNSPPGFGATESALTHIKNMLDADTILLSFHISKSNGWLWVVDRQRVSVYPVPSLDRLKSAVESFARAVRTGGTEATAQGSRLYTDVFGAVPAKDLAHKRWLLELDGPLFDLPFGALVVGERAQNEPIYLIERAALQSIPGALLFERPAPAGNGGFLGIGDPIYNAADTRYLGERGKISDRGKQAITLARVGGTAEELQACARLWDPASTRLLTGTGASLENVRAALRSNPSVVHFATHVLTAPGDYASGLIALSLDRAGAMGLLGPTEIVAHPLTAGLVVMNGCHSAQGETLPGAGLMGLTRAWIAAGARAVLATGWDIPDDAGKTMMVRFYSEFREHPERGPGFALQQAQLAVLKSNELGKTPAVWGAYFVLGRE